MGQKRTYKQYSKEYKEEAVALVKEQGYSVPEAAKSLGIASNMLYRWKEQISADVLHLYRHMKALFKRSRDSLDSREMMKKLCEEGFCIGRYRIRNLGKAKLKVRQRVAYKVTTKRNHRDAVALNLLNQNFNPVATNCRLVHQ